VSWEGSTTVASAAVGSREDAVSLLRISSACSEELGGWIGGTVIGALTIVGCSSRGSCTTRSLRYGKIDSVGLFGGSSDCEEDPVTVLERVLLVLGRRERLTPLPMLELLATERIEPGLWAECSMVGQRWEGCLQTLQPRPPADQHVLQKPTNLTNCHHQLLR